MREKIPRRVVEDCILIAIFAVGVLVVSIYLDGAIENFDKDNSGGVSGRVAAFTACIGSVLTIYAMKDNEDRRKIVAGMIIVFVIALCVTLFGTQFIINEYHRNSALMNPILSVVLPFIPWFPVYHWRRGWHWPWSRDG